MMYPDYSIEIKSNNIYLKFSPDFNKQIPNDLPNSITHLTFGYMFNQPLCNLPNSITHLTFGQFFNHSVVDLPKIIRLTFLGK